MNGDRGFALFFVLIILVILFSVITVFTRVIINDIKLSEYNYLRQQSVYKAEAALAKAIYTINKEDNITGNELEQISGSITCENDYYIKSAEIVYEDEKIKYIHLIAVGKTENIKSKQHLYYDLLD